MSDTTRVVEFEPGGRAVGLLNLDQGNLPNGVYKKERNTWKHTAPAQRNIESAGPNRWSGSRYVGQTHENGRVGARWFISGSTQAEAAANVEAFLSQVNSIANNRYIEFCPEGGGPEHCAFHEIRGPAEWDQEWQWIMWQQIKGVLIQVTWPTAPLPYKQKMYVKDLFNVAADAEPVATNFVYNTSAVVDATNFVATALGSGGTGTLTRSTDGVAHGSSYDWDIPSLVSNGSVAVRMDTPATGPRHFKYGDRLKLSCRFKIKTGSYTGANMNYLMAVSLRGPDGITMPGDYVWFTPLPTGSTTNVWHELSAVVVVGQTAPFNQGLVAASRQWYAHLEALVWNNTGSTRIGSFRATDFMVAHEPAGTTQAFFNGYSIRAKWNGTDNQSTSTLYKTGPQDDYERATDGDPYPNVLYSGLMWTSSASQATVHKQRGYRYTDVSVTVKGRWITGSDHAYMLSPIVKRLDNGSYIWATVEATNLRLYWYNPTTGANTILGSAGTITAPTIQALRWLSVAIRGDVITAHWWTADPQAGGSPAATTTYTLTDSFPSRHQYGAGKGGKVGPVGWAMNTGNEAVLEEWTVEPYAYRTLTVPVSVDLTGVPGTAPAEAEVEVMTSGQITPFALISLERKPLDHPNGSYRAPLGVIQAESADVLTGFSVNAGTAYRNDAMVDADTSLVTSATADFLISPSRLVPDEFAPNEVEVEVWVRARVPTTVKTPRVLASYRSSTNEAATSSMATYTSEWGSRGRLITGNDMAGQPTVHRAGTITMYTDTKRMTMANLAIKFLWNAGSTGTISFDEVWLFPVRSRAASPTGRLANAEYPYFTPNTYAWKKVIRSDLSATLATVGSGLEESYAHPGLSGSELLLQPGDNRLTILTATTVPDQPSGDADQDNTLSWVKVRPWPRVYSLGV